MPRGTSPPLRSDGFKAVPRAQRFSGACDRSALWLRGRCSCFDFGHANTPGDGRQGNVVARPRGEGVARGKGGRAQGVRTLQIASDSGWRRIPRNRGDSLPAFPADRAGMDDRTAETHARGKAWSPRLVDGDSNSGIHVWRDPRGHWRGHIVVGAAPGTNDARAARVRRHRARLRVLALGARNINSGTRARRFERARIPDAIRSPSLSAQLSDPRASGRPT